MVGEEGMERKEWGRKGDRGTGGKRKGWKRKRWGREGVGELVLL